MKEFSLETTQENEPKITFVSKFAHIYSIFNGDVNIGEIEIPTDLGGDTYMVSDITLFNQYREKGLGVATYEALIKRFDKPIQSFFATPEANNVWESLVRKGLAKKTDHGYISTFIHP